MNVIINYGLGNLTSVLNMHKRLGIEACITDDLDIISKASKVILPGVGHFDKGMQNLNKSGLTEILNQKILVDKIPVLGICLGAQLMTRKSEEGNELGLGWVNADTVRFQLESFDNYKVPHMGWGDINFVKPSLLWENTKLPARFYHVHAFHFKFDEPYNVIGTCKYGYEFATAFQNENIYGVQFHPEKSHKFGMKVLENFTKL
jgi:imidazole glycerol-phosphate synthase subunit HisH